MTSRAAAQAPRGRTPSLERPRATRRTRRAGLVVLAVALVGPGLYVLRTAGRGDAGAVWKAGEADLRAGRFDGAAEAVRRLERLRPPTPMDRMLRARVALARGRTDEGLAELALVPDGHALAAQARLTAGQVELRRRRARVAEGCFREALRLDPTLVAAHRELIYILGYQLRRAELNAEFRALSGLTEMTFDNVFHWCLLRSATWEPGTAIAELSRFVEADPEDRWSRLAIAENDLRMGLLDEAEKAIATLPDADPEALAVRAMLAIERHRDDEARRLLDSGPADHAGLARLRGRLALARRDGATAAREFRRALGAAPDDRESLFGLINALTMTGRDGEAAPYRERARRLDRLISLVQRAATAAGRQDPRLLRDLGAACAALGFDPEARAWYKLAIARDPLDVEAQRALYRLEARRKEAGASAGEGSRAGG